MGGAASTKGLAGADADAWGVGEWHGAEALKPWLVEETTLKEDPKNARLHPEANMKAIRDSLSRFGQTKPILVRNGIVVAGNGTLRAVRQLGWGQVAAVSLDHLSEAEATAYGVMDNKSGELAAWDFGILKDIFKALPANMLDMTGFNEAARAKVIEGKPVKSKDPHPRNIMLSAEQWTIVKGAIAHVRQTEDLHDTSLHPDGRILELICADWLTGQTTGSVS